MGEYTEGVLRSWRDVSRKSLYTREAAMGRAIGRHTSGISPSCLFPALSWGNYPEIRRTWAVRDYFRISKGAEEEKTLSHETV